MLQLDSARSAPALGVSVLGCFFLALLCVAWTWTPLTGNLPNERTRVYLSMALVEHGHVTIDDEVERFGPVLDFAQRAGHQYTDKAPGSSFLGAATYWLARKLAHDKVWDARRVLTLERTALMLPLALVGLLALFGIMRKLEVSRTSSLLATLAWLLATPTLHYAGAFYGHHLAAVFCVSSVWLCVCYPGSAAAFFAAGLAVGWAGLVEYQAGPGCLLIACWAAYTWRARPILIVWLGLGAALCGAALLLYNNAAFGGPFALSYSRVSQPQFVSNHNHGIGGIDAPRLDALVGLLFSVHRGLFVTAPVMLIAIVGSHVMLRRDPALGALTLAMFAVQLVVIAGYDAWWGGWSFGPRLLLPMSGLAMIPVAFGLDRLRANRLGRVLAVGLIMAGFVQNQAMESIGFEVAETIRNPVFDVALPALATGRCAPSLGNKLGLTGCWGQLPAVLLAAFLLLGAWNSWSMCFTRQQRHLAVCAALGVAALGLGALRLIA